MLLHEFNWKKEILQASEPVLVDFWASWFAAPEEGAALVAYVCSPRASATNGAALRVDVGLVRSIL